MTETTTLHLTLAVTYALQAASGVRVDIILRPTLLLPYGSFLLVKFRCFIDTLNKAESPKSIFGIQYHHTNVY